MRRTWIAIPCTLLLLSGCDGSSHKTEIDSGNQAASSPTAEQARLGQKGSAPSSGQLPEFDLARTKEPGGGGGGGRSDEIVSDADQASLSTISAVQASALATERKIIRDAELTLEVDSPTDGLRQVTSIAQANGGFVVTSDLKQANSGTQSKPSETVNVVLRVPATRFATALEQVRGTGKQVISEKVRGQDVSEEYLDLEARLRTKKALELRFLEIMKQARKVSDALDVQRELGDVRTEIERLEGRRLFLENQAAISTITVTYQMPQPLVVATTGGFSHSVKRAFGDAVDVAASIILTIIQAIIVMTPVVLLLGVPCWLIWRAVRRRIHIGTKQPSVVPES